jgi:hypothetical protein
MTSLADFYYCPDSSYARVEAEAGVLAKCRSIHRIAPSSYLAWKTKNMGGIT